MDFEDFILWVTKKLADWKEFPTLGEIKRRIRNQPLRGKSFLVKYDPVNSTMFYKKPWYDKEGRNPIKLKKEHLLRIFKRFMGATEQERITSSYFQIQNWDEAPDKVATPAIASVIWHWYNKKL